MKLSKQISIVNRLHYHIQKKHLGSSLQLAAKLGISQATLFRYFSFLKDNFNAPIRYSKQGNYYYYSDEGFDIDFKKLW